MTHDIAHSSNSRNRKAWLFSTVSALAISASILGSAWADSPYPGFPVTSSDPEGGVVAAGYTTLLNNVGNSSATLSATITNGLDGIQVEQGPGSSAVVTANSFTASAGGNDVTNSVIGTTLPLPNISVPESGLDGVVALNNSTNLAVKATATIATSNLQQGLPASVSVATVSGNTMAANVTLNQSATTVQGQVPVNYMADTADYPGAFSSANDSGPYFATASVLATTAQFNSASGQLAGSAALVTGSNVGQTITGADATADVLNGSPAVTGNSMTANFVGNSAASALTISAGGAPTFFGSTALTNVQQNSADAGSTKNAMAATVVGSTIGFDLVPGSGDEETPASVSLAGALAMTGNTISAMATGNLAAGTSLSGPTGNVLTLDGGIGLQGSSLGGSIVTFFDGAAPGIDVSGDAVVNNWQNNNATPLASTVQESGVSAGTPIAPLVVVGGTVALSNNAITAQTVGNQAYNALLAPGLGTPGTGSQLNGVLALGNMQSNQDSPLSATISDAGVSLVTDTVTNATLAAAGNTVSAAATGNSAVNNVNLNSSDLASFNGHTAGTFGERNPTEDLGVNADVMLNSLQSNDANSPVEARNLGGGVQINAAISGGGVAGSALSVTGTTNAALATGNAATNSLTLTGSSVTTSAALLGAQSSYGEVTATLVDPTAWITTGGGDPLNSTLALTGTLQRAIATGNNASSTLTVTGSSIAVANTGGPASVFSYVPSLAFPIASDGKGDNQTSAGFIAHNDQATTAPVSATVAFPGPSALISVADGLNASTADNSTNAVVAAARANQATTQLTLSPSGSLGIYLGASDNGSVYSPFAVVANVQTLGDDTDITATISPGKLGSPPEGGELPPPPILTDVSAGGLTGATLTMNANQVAALAQANNATNGLTLSSAGTVTEPSESPPLGLLVPLVSGKDVESASLTADAAFVVHNLQYAGTGLVSATQDATGVQAAIAGNIAGSTVTIGGSTAALGNAIASTATANLADNALTLDAANMSASSGLVNFQVSNGTTSTTMGEPGSLPTSGTSVDFDAVVSTKLANGTSNAAFTATPVGDGYTLAGTLKTLDARAADYGWTLGAGGYYYLTVTAQPYSGVPPGFGTTVPIDHSTPPTPGAWGSPAFVATLNGNVTNSVLSVTQNTVNATSTGNSANNAIAATSAISSSSLGFNKDLAPPPDGKNPPKSFAGPGATVDFSNGAVVLADVGLLNNQTLGASGGSTAEANGSFGISNTAAAPVYTNATLSVSDNTQQASALGNTATNSLTLSPGITPTTLGTTPVTASILSVQTVTSDAEIPVSASSNMLIGAPMAMTGSTLSMSGNTNTASAVVNDVTNTLTVTGTTSLPGSIPGQTGAVQASLIAGAIQAVGDYTLVNAQTVSGGIVQSTAVTTLVNNDFYLDPGAISGTSVAVDSNTTVAQALGNRASNMLAITAAGSSGATGAVANGQVNLASIGATATIDTAIALGQAPGTQLGQSTSNNATYGITNNATQALATGNQASNVLNASPAAYGTATVLSGSNSTSPGSVQSSATYAVLNAQLNSGPVAAVVNGASPTLLTGATTSGGYVMALNTTGTGNVVNMSGNTVTSQAIGNRANNAVTLAALNTGTASTSISSIQQNTGAISASISNVQVSAALPAGSVGRVGGNSLAASAFGNVSTNSIVTH